MGIWNKTGAPWLYAMLLIMAGLAAAQSPDPDPSQLSRFQERIRQDLRNIPNYTCLETIERAHRTPHSRTFKPIDTLRLEVSSVSGKEMFAWPGARQFEDLDVMSLVTSGTIGSGIYASFAHHLFVVGTGTIQYGGKEHLAGRACVRYEFHMTQQESSLLLTFNGNSETVAARGSFWFDPVSLDLMRLDVRAEAIPYSLRLQDALIQIHYERVHVGDANALLPKLSELTMTHFSGEASRAAFEFSQCRAYRTESTISFDPPPTLPPEVPKPALRQVDLPAGLLVPVELESAIDSKTARVGDALHGRVVQEVRYQGEVAIPLGAAITGRVRKLERGASSAPFAVGIEMSEVEWEGARATFQGELVDLDRKSAGSHRPVTYFDGHAYKVLIESGMRGVGIFYLAASGFHIAPGFRTVWRTLPRSGAATRPALAIPALQHPR